MTAYFYGKTVHIKPLRKAKLGIWIDGKRVKGRSFADVDTALSAAEIIVSGMVVKIAAPDHAMTAAERNRINGYHDRKGEWRWAQPPPRKHIAEQFHLSLGDHQISKEELQIKLEQREEEKSMIIQDLRQREAL